MKILFASPLMITGGAERMVSDLGRGLMDRGHRVGVASSGGHFADVLSKAGATVHDMPQLAARWPPKLLAAATRLAGVLRREGYDLVNSQSYLVSLVAFAAIRMARRDVRHVYTLHLIENPRVYALLGRTLGWTTDGIVAVSESNKQRLVAHGIAPGKVRVIYNAVDLSAFGPAHVAADRNHLRIGIVARLIPRKGHATLLRAIARVNRKRGPGWATVQIIGSGAELGVLTTLVADLGLEGQVQFMGDRTDVPDLLRELDVAVLPSTYEGFPISIIESMATGLCVIASSVDGIPEVVDDEQTGLLVPPGDAQRLANALERVADDPDLRARLGALGAATVGERFGLEGMIDSAESWFESMVRARAGATRG